MDFHIPKNMKIRPFITGLLSHLPGMQKYFGRKTGGTVSARYCYSVWLRHLVIAHQNGVDDVPNIVAELGPGESLGVGLSALLSGAERYYAFEMVAGVNRERNLAVFDELISLFQKKEAIPGESEFPRVKPFLSSYEFPEQILTDNRLERALSNERLQKIRKSIQSLDKKNGCIQYKVPWFHADVIMSDTVDLILSQAVFEHIDDLEATYKSLFSWLKPGGVVSNQIDFKSHGTSSLWNGHWAYNDFLWQIIKGKRPYLINRAPFSRHLDLAQKVGLSVLETKRVNSESRLRHNDLALDFQGLSDEDLTTSGGYFLARK